MESIIGNNDLTQLISSYLGEDVKTVLLGKNENKDNKQIIPEHSLPTETKTETKVETKTETKTEIKEDKVNSVLNKFSRFLRKPVKTHSQMLERTNPEIDVKTITDLMKQQYDEARMKKLNEIKDTVLASLNENNDDSDSGIEENDDTDDNIYSNCKINNPLLQESKTPDSPTDKCNAFIESSETSDLMPGFETTTTLTDSKRILNDIIQTYQTINLSEEKTTPQFKLVYWRPIVTYISTDHKTPDCKICKNSLHDYCVKCYHEMNRQNTEATVRSTGKGRYVRTHNSSMTDCVVAKGECGDSFHLHCIQAFTESNNKCPISTCLRDWKLVPNSA